MRSAVLAAVLLAFSTTTWAEPPTSGRGAGAAAQEKGRPAAKPSAQARALSRALVTRQSWDQLLDRSADGLSQAVSRSLATKGEAIPDGLRDDLRRELARTMNYDEAVDTQAHALQKRFTVGELERAAAFYGSPVGKKMLDQLPEAQTEVGTQLQQQLAMEVPDILHRVAPGALEAGTGEGAPEPGEEDLPPGSSVDTPGPTPVPLGGGPPAGH